MASISTLPDDIIYYIALNFERDRKNLASLTLVSCAFHHATRGLLFRHVGGRDGLDKPLLQRSFDNDPKLRSMVHSTATIRLDYRGIKNDGLNKALAFPNLRELSFEFTFVPKIPPSARGLIALRLRDIQLWAGRDDEDFECGFLEDRTFSGIRKISLSGEFTTTEVIRFMMIPGLKILEGYPLGRLKRPALFDRIPFTKTTITSLDLIGGSVWSIEPSTMRIILSYCPSLQSLCCQIPMVTTTRGRHTILTTTVDGTISPVELNAVFEPVKQTLQELSLLDLRNDVSFDGSHMDFSGFHALTSLLISSGCLLPPGAPSDKRNNLHNLLPKGLQDLKLDFPNDSGIFYHRGEDNFFDSQGLQAIPSSRYFWITHFLSQKARYVPNLINLNISDQPEAYLDWDQSKWDPPQEITELCQLAGVELNVQFSHPRVIFIDGKATNPLYLESTINS